MYLPGKLSLIFFLLATFIISLSIDAGYVAEDVDKKIQNNVQSIKKTYLTPKFKKLNVSWAPEKDPDIFTNKLFCLQRSKNKVEKIGKLECVKNSFAKYSITRNGVQTDLLYSILTGDLSLLTVKYTGKQPIAKYFYRVNYPDAQLTKLSVVYNANHMMSFDSSGKLDVYVYDNKTSCKTEDSKGQIIDHIFARSLCTKRVLGE